LKEKAQIEELTRNARHRVEQWLDLSEKTFEFACTARTRFAEGNAKTKKEILLTIGSNLTLKDNRLSIQAKKPFFILEKSPSGYESLNQTIEPEDLGSQQGQQMQANNSGPSMHRTRFSEMPIKLRE
jgi:hypothetical protein